MRRAALGTTSSTFHPVRRSYQASTRTLPSEASLRSMAAPTAFVAHVTPSSSLLFHLHSPHPRLLLLPILRCLLPLPFRIIRLLIHRFQSRERLDCARCTASRCFLPRLHLRRLRLPFLLGLPLLRALRFLPRSHLPRLPSLRLLLRFPLRLRIRLFLRPNRLLRIRLRLLRSSRPRLGFRLLSLRCPRLAPASSPGSYSSTWIR